MHLYTSVKRLWYTKTIKAFIDLWTLSGDEVQNIKCGSQQQQIVDKISSALERQVDKDGTAYFCMRHTLMEWTPDPDDNSQGTWRRPEEVRPVPPETANHMAALVKASTMAQINNAFAALGIPVVPSADIRTILKTLGRYVVFLVGPAATQFWKLQAEKTENANMHAQALCGFCSEAGLHCTCEHIYAALMQHTAHIPRQVVHTVCHRRMAERIARRWRA